MIKLKLHSRLKVNDIYEIYLEHEILSFFFSYVFSLFDAINEQIEVKKIAKAKETT